MIRPRKSPPYLWLALGLGNGKKYHQLDLEHLLEMWSYIPIFQIQELIDLGILSLKESFYKDIF